VSDERDLCFLPATEIAARIRDREISAREVMQAHLAQIDRVNPTVNAIVTQLPQEQCLTAADDADRALARGKEVGPLHGLPIAHKDLEPTKGIRTTFGSLIFKDNVPDFDTLMVQRLRAAGAITIGKTNTPEFGAGSQTFNAIFGATLNPYDTSTTCGGSSGGAAVALACGMLPIADGSDLGGSLRNPGSFNNVVGVRCSPGRVPNVPSQANWFWMSVKGPMARTVADAALLLSAIAGPDPRDPTSIDQPGDRFRDPLDRDFSGARIAWSDDLGGLPIDSRVTAVLNQGRTVVESTLGCDVVDATPDLSDADEVFQVLRAFRYTASYGPLLEKHRDLMKDTVIWNTEKGLALSALDVATAEVKQTALYARMCRFFDEYDFLLCPATQVVPFDVEIPYLTEINGVEMENYLSWMRSAYWISATGLPALSVPCGFTDDGLPVGLQIVGRPRDDFGILQLAYAFEQATGHWRRRPDLAVR
jgi:amidase